MLYFTRYSGYLWFTIVGWMPTGQRLCCCVQVSRRSTRQWLSIHEDKSCLSNFDMTKVRCCTDNTFQRSRKQRAQSDIPFCMFKTLVGGYISESGGCVVNHTRHFGNFLVQFRAVPKLSHQRLFRWWQTIHWQELEILAKESICIWSMWFVGMGGCSWRQS